MPGHRRDLPAARAGILQPPRRAPPAERRFDPFRIAPSRLAGCRRESYSSAGSRRHRHRCVQRRSSPPGSPAPCPVCYRPAPDCSGLRDRANPRAWRDAGRRLPDRISPNGCGLYPTRYRPRQLWCPPRSRPQNCMPPLHRGPTATAPAPGRCANRSVPAVALTPAAVMPPRRCNAPAAGSRYPPARHRPARSRGRSQWPAPSPRPPPDRRFPATEPRRDCSARARGPALSPAPAHRTGARR